MQRLHTSLAYLCISDMILFEGGVWFIYLHLRWVLSPGTWAYESVSTPPGWEVLDDLPHCLLYRQEGYIPSNYVTEAEDSIEMYE